MITSMKLVAGARAGDPGLELSMRPSVTVFVGPNNSGKSLVLREISQFCVSGNSGHNVLDTLKFKAVDAAEADADLQSLLATDAVPDPRRPEYRQIAGISGYADIHLPSYRAGRLDPQGQRESYATTYLSHYARHLDGQARLALLRNEALGNMRKPQTMMARLLSNDELRTRIRTRIHNQLGKCLVVDITDYTTARVCLGPMPPPNERSIEPATVEYMRTATQLDEQSDGVKAFCGLMAQIHVGTPKILTIDEPEAFLAPPLAHALGREIATAAIDEGKQIFVGTHSSHFLMGAISTGAEINIIRLTYEDGISTARLLPSSELLKLMNDPLLRSANVLSGLFYRGVIVTEADADRAFYQECNERLLAQSDVRGCSDTLFLNANGKDVIPIIIGLLRRLGIPAASIADLDVLKEGGVVWTRHLTASGIPTPDHAAFQGRRANISLALEQATPTWKRDGGINVLAGAPQAAAQALLEDLAHYGMFIVQRGEIEAWLSNLAVGRAKHTWLREIFEKMGNDPTAAERYVRPAQGDVWDFVGSVAAWMKDSRRRGVS